MVASEVADDSFITIFGVEVEVAFSSAIDDDSVDETVKVVALGRNVTVTMFCGVVADSVVLTAASVTTGADVDAGRSLTLS